jgi:hypothetical protein
MKTHRIHADVPAWCVLVVLVLGLGLPASAGAQGPGQASVLPVQDLVFGVLAPGLPVAIDPRDTARRAEVEIRGKGTFLAQVVLPTVMTSASGASFPLTFSKGDVVVEYLRFGGAFTVDPTAPFELPIQARQQGVLLYLGGTASPAAAQAPGAYSASITIRVSNLGT